MSDPVRPIFVNTLQVNGFLNGVLNLAFSSAQWYPAPDLDDSTKITVAVSEPITVDLRMDLLCAQQLRDALDRIIEANTSPAGKAN